MKRRYSETIRRVYRRSQSFMIFTERLVYKRSRGNHKHTYTYTHTHTHTHTEEEEEEEEVEEEECVQS